MPRFTAALTDPEGSVSPDTFVVWKEGVRRGKPSVVHRHLGAKDRKLVYSMQGGTSTESVDVHASRRRQWSMTRGEALELARMAIGHDAEVIAARVQSQHLGAGARVPQYRLGFPVERRQERWEGGALLARKL